MKRVNIISKIVARGGGTVVSPSKNDAPVDLSDYLLKEVWDKCWEVRRTDEGDEYLFGKLPIALQFDLTSFVDEGLIDLPTLYDGLPIDNKTIYWEDVTDENGKKSRVLKVAETGDDEYSWDEITDKPSWIGNTKPSYSWDEITGKPLWIGSSKPSYSWSEITGKPLWIGSSKPSYSWDEITGKPSWIGSSKPSYSWDEITGKPSWIGSSKPSYSWSEITGKPSWIGSLKPSYSWDEITGKPDLSDMATKTWVGNNFLSLKGGTLTGDLRLEGSSAYGTTLYFGDGSYCYISEPSDDMMKVYASKGIVLQTGSSYYVEVSSKGLKVNGGILEYNGEYWVLNGDLLVNGGITSNG